MHIECFKKSEEFLRVFDINDSLYFGIVHYIDGNIAFSIKRNYPSNIRFQPSRTRSGEDNEVALIHVLYNYPNESINPCNSENVPIKIEIMKFNLYLNNRFLYKYEDEDCPTEKSLNIMGKSAQPIGLEDKYFYCHSRNAFLNSNGKSISGRQMLDKIFKEHCDTVHLIKGLRIRTIVKFKETCISLCNWLGNNVAKYILKVALGYTLDEKRVLAMPSSGYVKNDLRLINDKTINLFGYKAPHRVVIAFSFLFLVFVVFLVSIDSQVNLLHKISGNAIFTGLITITFVFLSLWFLEHAMPIIIIKIINGLWRLRVKILLIGIKEVKE